MKTRELFPVSKDVWQAVKDQIVDKCQNYTNTKLSFRKVKTICGEQIKSMQKECENIAVCAHCIERVRVWITANNRKLLAYLPPKNATLPIIEAENSDLAEKLKSMTLSSSSRLATKQRLRTQSLPVIFSVDVQRHAAVAPERSSLQLVSKEQSLKTKIIDKPVIQNRFFEEASIFYNEKNYLSYVKETARQQKTSLYDFVSNEILGLYKIKEELETELLSDSIQKSEVKRRARINDIKAANTTLKVMNNVLIKVQSRSVGQRHLLRIAYQRRPVYQVEQPIARESAVTTIVRLMMADIINTAEIESILHNQRTLDEIYPENFIDQVINTIQNQLPRYMTLIELINQIKASSRISPIIGNFLDKLLSRIYFRTL